MKLSTRGRYGTRAMTELAANYGKGPMMLEEISSRQQISRRYLEHIFADLKAAGLVRGLRGPRGGYVLTRDPREIPVSEIVAAVEGSLSIADCLEDEYRCEMASRCRTRALWQEVNKAIMKVLKSKTLAELLDPTRKCAADVVMFEI